MPRGRPSRKSTNANANAAPQTQTDSKSHNLKKKTTQPGPRFLCKCSRCILIPGGVFVTRATIRKHERADLLRQMEEEQEQQPQQAEEVEESNEQGSTHNTRFRHYWRSYLDNSLQPAVGGPELAQPGTLSRKTGNPGTSVTGAPSGSAALPVPQLRESAAGPFHTESPYNEAGPNSIQASITPPTNRPAQWQEDYNSTDSAAPTPSLAQSVVDPCPLRVDFEGSDTNRDRDQRLELGIDDDNGGTREDEDGMEMEVEREHNAYPEAHSPTPDISYLIDSVDPYSSDFDLDIHPEFGRAAKADLLASPSQDALSGTNVDVDINTDVSTKLDNPPEEENEFKHECINLISDDLPPVFDEHVLLFRAYYRIFRLATVGGASEECCEDMLTAIYHAYGDVERVMGMKIGGLERMARTLGEVKRRLGDEDES